MLQKWNETILTLKEKAPTVHCLMGPISINQCANAVLAMGARPIMAEYPKEVRGITQTASALLLNLSGITKERMRAMNIAAKTAKQMDIPVVLDAVGVACSPLRRRFALRLLRRRTPALIKGNGSEMMALAYEHYRSVGVDSEQTLTEEAVLSAAVALAKRHHCVVMVSGKRDIVTDGARCALLHNGVPRLAKVTGTGCLLGALAACCVAVGDVFSGGTLACAVLDIAGEMAETEGNGRFLIGLLNALSVMDMSMIESKIKMEAKEIEAV